MTVFRASSSVQQSSRREAQPFTSTTRSICRLVLAGLFALAFANSSRAQTIGYAEAIDRLAKSCGQDIDKYCKKVALGGGRVQQCLDQNQADVSASCKSSVSALRTLLQVRATARSSVARIKAERESAVSASRCGCRLRSVPGQRSSDNSNQPELQ